MMRESEVIMTNNDFLRRLRYALNLKDNVTVQIFKKGGLTVTKEDVVNYLKKDIGLANDGAIKGLEYAKTWYDKWPKGMQDTEGAGNLIQTQSCF